MTWYTCAYCYWLIYLILSILKCTFWVRFTGYRPISHAVQLSAWFSHSLHEDAHSLQVLVLISAHSPLGQDFLQD